MAIGIVLRELLSRPQTDHLRTRVFIFTDGLYASSATLSTKPPNSHSDTIRAIRALLVQVTRIFTVSFHWIRGHINAGGNERADSIAKSYAHLSVGIPTATAHLSFVAHRTVSRWPFGLTSVPLGFFLAQLPKASLPVDPQSDRVTSHDPCVNVLTTPTHDDPTLRCTSVSGEIVLAHSPKTCLPPVVQYPCEAVKDHIVNVLSIASVNARATSCTPPIVSSWPRTMRIQVTPPCL